MNEMMFEEIIQKYTDTVFRLALNQTGNRADAEDITQEVFLYMFKSSKSFDSDEYIKAWLIRSTINRCHSFFRSAYKKHVVTVDELPELTDNGKNVFTDVEESEVYAAVQNLPAKYKAAIHLFYYEDMSIAEIAIATGTKENTVKSQLSRGREMLAKTITKEAAV